MPLTINDLVAIQLGLTGILAAGLQYFHNIKKRRRRFHARPILNARSRLGHFNTLFYSMKIKDEEQFFKYTRMSGEQFDELVNLIKPHLKKCPQRQHLSCAERLVMTVHFLATGCSMRQIAWQFYVGHSTVHMVIHETTRLLWNVLQPLVLKAPESVEEWEIIASQFLNKWNMPNCVGAIDGKHIAIQAPSNSGSVFFNYKKHFSIVLMAACDAYYRFTLVDIGAAGGNHDGYVLRQSGFGQALLNGQLGLPAPRNLPNSDMQFPFFFVADAAFPLHENIMRPYPGSYLPEVSRIFNYRLSRARRVIENAFGILVQRWRFLRGTIVANVDNCEAFVKAAVVLHNFLQQKEIDIPLDQRRYCRTGHLDENVGIVCRASLRPIGRLGANNSTRGLREARDNLAQWFVSDAGAVAWQRDAVFAGGAPQV